MGIDLGQIQGAFVMGLGFFLKEYMQYSEDGTHLLTNDTWEYKPPCAQDIPHEFNVAYFRDGPTKNLVYGAKGLGEPPLFMAVSAVNAIRQCIMSARSDASKAVIFPQMDLPCTPARTSKACDVDVSKLKKTADTPYVFEKSEIPARVPTAPGPPLPFYLVVGAAAIGAAAAYMRMRKAKSA